MLSASHIIKRYDGHAVVNDVGLTINKGEYVSITGPSGAGKSTLLHIIGMLDRPDSGSVLIDGIDPLSFSSRRQARFRGRYIGFVFQFHHLFPEFTAVENVAIPLWITGHSRKKGLSLAADLLGKVGLVGKDAHKPSQLSGGEQQRVAIARALANAPKVIMADEPTGNLDSANAIAVHELFRSLAGEGTTIVMVTHNEDLAKLTDRTVMMRDGSIVEIRQQKNSL